MYHGIRRWRFGERTVLKDRPLINGGTTLIITVWFLLFCYPPCEHTITWLTSTNQQCSCPTSNLSMPWSWNPWSQQLWVFLFKTRKLWVCVLWEIKQGRSNGHCCNFHYSSPDLVLQEESKEAFHVRLCFRKSSFNDLSCSREEMKDRQWMKTIGLAPYTPRLWVN